MSCKRVTRISNDPLKIEAKFFQQAYVSPRRIVVSFVSISADLSPVQVPLLQTPLGQGTDSESDTDSSSGFSTPVATSGESTKEETTTEKRPEHGNFPA